jgi:hypothetical protein
MLLFDNACGLFLSCLSDDTTLVGFMFFTHSTLNFVLAGNLNHMYTHARPLATSGLTSTVAVVTAEDSCGCGDGSAGTISAAGADDLPAALVPSSSSRESSASIPAFVEHSSARSPSLLRPSSPATPDACLAYLSSTGCVFVVRGIDRHLQSLGPPCLGSMEVNETTLECADRIVNKWEGICSQQVRSV